LQSIVISGSMRKEGNVRDPRLSNEPRKRSCRAAGMLPGYSTVPHFVAPTTSPPLAAP
jgi:hypothetical protein